jgi:cytochrome c oxidase cbb3-type subunit 3
MTPPASFFVIIFTTINVVACVWLLWWTARARPGSKHPNEVHAQGVVEKVGHVWDGDLEELNNPLPRWWLWLFVITIFFGAGYLTFYPGLGNFSGTGKWSSVSAYEHEVGEQRAQFEHRMESIKGKTVDALAADSQAMATAGNLFGQNCSACHGSDARGARGYPNLTDRDWLLGGGSARVYETIANGRHGVMPAWGPVLGHDGVQEVAAYVVSLSGTKAPADWIDSGKARFATLCTGCHGADGRGNKDVGAPDLTDRVWLHGGDFETVVKTITDGRDSAMPAHETSLGDTKVRLLAAYVLSLSQRDGETVAAVAPTSQHADTP